ncbi:MAG: GYF domain-containing protein [Mollicutes bacterium]|nr:GYF domain-containing protein [Mollicutes bacterium]
MKKKVNDTVCRYIKDAVANAPAENNIPVINIESKIDFITEKVEMKIKDRVAELFGVRVNGVEINAIELDKESDAYLELKSVTKDLAKRQAEANVLNYEEQLRIQREEGQYAQHMATRQTNLGAYQREVQGQVGVAGAEALGKMGENGAGQVNMGSGAGFNPMTMMAGIAVGSAVGQNIAGTMNGAMNGQPLVPPVAPPPVPTVKYYLAKDGAATGPYDVATLKGMIPTGAFNGASLVWKEGMAAWARADSVPEFAGAFPPSL